MYYNFFFFFYLNLSSCSILPPLQWRVRKEAMMGLAQLYKKYCLHHEAGKESAQKISWIKDKLLHIYYQNSIDDKWEYTGRYKYNVKNNMAGFIN